MGFGGTGVTVTSNPTRRQNGHPSLGTPISLFMPSKFMPSYSLYVWALSASGGWMYAPRARPLIIEMPNEAHGHESYSSALGK